MANEHSAGEGVTSRRERRTTIARRVLTELPDRERRALIQFYLHECDAQEACRRGGFTDVEFLMLKVRTRTRYEELAAQMA